MTSKSASTKMTMGTASPATKTMMTIASTKFQTKNKRSIPTTKEIYPKGLKHPTKINKLTPKVDLSRL